jgi:hypothetical protein
MSLASNATFFHGRLTMSASFDYQKGMMQNNLGAFQSGLYKLIPNTPGTTLATQAAFVAADCYTGRRGACKGGNSNPGSPIGFLQNVNTLSFNYLSLTYRMPHKFSQWLHASSTTVSIQGNNLGLFTNYRGKDPRVNVFSTVHGGDQTVDYGQIPEPRSWWLKLTLGN